MEKKKLPVGINDFKKIIEKNYYYIDKTLFIEELLEKRAKVTLITRPRRFGKTLNLSMLKYFFDINNSEENRKLFEGLNISKTKYMNYQGKYPVIYLNMKELTGENYEEVLTKLKKIMSALYDEYKFLRENLNEFYQIQFDKIWLAKTEANYSFGIKFLSEILHKYYGVEPVILIDEYDYPMLSAREHGYYNELNMFLGTLYGSALKDTAIQFGVLTGVFGARGSIFSSLDHLLISTIQKGDYNYFGMTEKEIGDILRYYYLTLKIYLSENQNNSHSYILGDLKIYNTESIIEYCSLKRFGYYY